MLDAIKRAGRVDESAIRDALAKMDTDAVAGHIKFDENRNPPKHVVIIEIEDGRQEYLTSVNP
jgi:branched-chain amino acid transport system substrate-binding protein